MSILSRFFGNKDSKDEAGLIVNPDMDSSLSLQVLLSGDPKLHDQGLAKSFSEYHPGLKKSRVEIDADLASNGTPLGLIGWGEHVIQIIGFDQPMPAAVVEKCVAPSHYDQALKAQARAHKSHLLFYYKGYATHPIKQYAAMALVAGFLSNYGAIVVTNENAHTSLPAAALNGNGVDGDIAELLENLPLAMLYSGIVKYEVEGVDGVWLRSYGAPLLGLPDLAAKIQDHSSSESIFNIFNNVFAYLLSSGAQFMAGNTMQVGDDLFMKLRMPIADEYYLDSDDVLFVAEFVPESEINA